MRGALGDVTARGRHLRDAPPGQEALEFDVTSCRFAELFRAPGEPELGAVLVCQTDFDIASVAEGAVHLKREQTLMQGESCCSFRDRFEPREWHE
jgi:hypothetical protein